MSKMYVILCGIYSIAFGVFHLFFSRIFQWNRTLSKLNFTNRAILRILNLQLAFVFFVVGTSCFLFTYEIESTKAGKYFLIANCLFWVFRTINQFIFFRRNFWQIHLLTLVFLLGSLLFFLPLVL